MASPLALAPAASAQSGGALGGLDTLLQGMLEGLIGATRSGTSSAAAAPSRRRCYTPDGLGATLSCVIVPLKNTLDPGRQGQGKVKATMRNGKVTPAGSTGSSRRQGGSRGRRRVNRAGRVSRSSAS